MNGAIGQFSDTEKWMKTEKVEELYDHFDVDFYEKARLMVNVLQNWSRALLTASSTHNGQVTETEEAYHCTSSSSSISTARTSRSTRRSRKHTRRACRAIKARVHLQSCCRCSHYIITSSISFYLCALPLNDQTPKFLLRTLRTLSISHTLA